MDRPAEKLLGRHAECEFLAGALADAGGGRSRVVMLRGEAGAGKSVLVDYAVKRAHGWRVATAVGIESEMELPYSGLHQLCAPMLDHVDRLPIPQRDALRIVFGQQAGAAPDRFLVGLATLTLLAEVAEEQPLLCVIDDAQWLDTASAQIVQFVARRLLAERIAVVCAARSRLETEALPGLPELAVAGLRDADARALLLRNLNAPFDAAVCEQIVTESHGNPLALLELPRTWNVADLAGGFGLPARHPVAARIEQSFAKRLLALPAETQLLVLAAAAEPLGDPLLLQRAVEILGLDMTEAEPAVDARLLDIGAPSGSHTRWCAPRPTDRRRTKTAIVCTAHSPRRPTPSGTSTGVPGIWRARRSGRTKGSPPSSSARPDAPRPGAESPPPPRSWSARPRSRPTRRSARGARSRPRRPSSWPERRTPPRPWSRPRPTGRWTRSRARSRGACRDRSPWTCNEAGRRCRCSSTRRAGWNRSTRCLRARRIS